MKIIAVEKKGLLADFRDWGVSKEYADLFVSKCEGSGEAVALRSFTFNDTIQQCDLVQWLSACTAFWCRAYREAESNTAQVEALSSIRSLYFLAAFMGASSVVVMIDHWWRSTYELHHLSAPNQSQSKPPSFRSALLKAPFLHH
ncbi:TPA: hypothetical protein MFA45_001405 [Klebsiella pneumoniae]|nr:hypothetical protein [Klebsiella pneumoniae]HBQ1007734.1 hypothetical protein [Klebsiella pneumoniae]HBQ1226915.1 hypothetical protein [Klebsiella pneumoniae]HBU6406161.1 hypothetical protein [Klebsiella pneumoniae]HBU6460619.1 hypothetical protein [Klebsiella pneumoniae]